MRLLIYNRRLSFFFKCIVFKSYRKIWRVVIIGYEMPAIKLDSHSKNGNVFIRNTRGHWKKLEYEGLTLHAKGNISYQDARRLYKILRKDDGSLTFDRLPDWLNSITVNFGLIGVFNRRMFAAADWIGSTPIFYAIQPSRVTASNDAPLLANTICQPIFDSIDQNAWLSFEASGYTIGSSTLHKSIKKLKPGQFLTTETKGVFLRRYHRYEPWNYVKKCEKNLSNSLSGITLEVFKSLAEKADGRQIAVPISAGFDSRLVASALKYIGAKNVICFSYGQAGNSDAVTGKAIAERLGYPWHFF